MAYIADFRGRAVTWVSRGMFGAIAGVLLPAGAATLGDVTVHSSIGRPLLAEVQIVAPSTELPTLIGGVNLDLPCRWQSCRETADAGQAVVERRLGDRATLKITSTVPMEKPYVDLQAWVTWDESGQIKGYVRNYRVALAGTGAVKPSPASASLDVPAAKQFAEATSVPANTDDVAVREVVRLWTAAWSRKSVEEYLQHYASDFEVPGGRQRRVWEQERWARIAGRAGEIEVACADVQVEIMEPGRVKATCQQTYRSVTYSSRGEKALWLKKVNGEWLIFRERMDGERPM